MTDLYSIVVVGRMNPAIHHPTWCRHNGLISEDEHDAAIQAGAVVLPVYAHLDVPAFRIVCQQERWEIQTRDANARERVLEVAKRVFELLDHTPVSALGFNVNLIRETKLTSVAGCLAKAVNALGFDCLGGAPESASLSLTRETKAGVLRVRVSPVSASQSAVAVATNAHYPLEGSLGEHVALTPIFDSHFLTDCDRAAEYADVICGTLNKLGRADNARHSS